MLKWSILNTLEESICMTQSLEQEEIGSGFAFTKDEWVWFLEGIENSSEIQKSFDDSSNQSLYMS